MAVEQLNKFFISESKGQLLDNPQVEMYPGSLVFRYPLKEYLPEELKQLRVNLDMGPLNRILRNKVYTGKDGDIVFKVTSVVILHPQDRNVAIGVNFKYITNVSDTYFSVVPNDLVDIIMSTLDKYDDIMAFCASLDVCDDN